MVVICVNDQRFVHLKIDFGETTNQSDLVTELNDEILMKKESISKPYFCCFHNHGKVGDKGYFERDFAHGFLHFVRKFV